MNSHELPVPPETALKRVIAASELAKTPARPLPKPSWKTRLSIISLCLVLVSLMVWLSWRYQTPTAAMIVLFVFAFVAALWGAFLHRCPQCRHRLGFRTEDVYGTSLYRQLYDCPHCGTVWDTGAVGDHEKDKG